MVISRPPQLGGEMSAVHIYLHSRNTSDGTTFQRIIHYLHSFFPLRKIRTMPIYSPLEEIAGQQQTKRILHFARGLVGWL